MALGEALINGFLFDASTIELNARGRRMYGVTEINYKPTVDPSGVNALGRVGPIGHTLGQGNYEGSMTMVKAYADEFLKELTINGKCPFMLEIFDVVVNYIPQRPCGGSTNLAPSQEMVTDILQSCRIKTYDTSASGGSDAMKVKFDLVIGGMTLNGLEPFPGARI